MSSRTFTGKVVQVDPGLYSSNGTSVVRAIVRLDSVDASFNLPLGTSASVDVIGGQRAKRHPRPARSLEHRMAISTSFTLLENGVPTERVVEIGIQDTLYAEVLSGLEPGDVVVTNYTETK